MSVNGARTENLIIIIETDNVAGFPGFASAKASKGTSWTSRPRNAVFIRFLLKERIDSLKSYIKRFGQRSNSPR
jgi:hypothetical protein